MITLFHFSDLHLSPDSNIYEKTDLDVSNIILNEIEKNNFKIDNIIFTGDFAYKEKGFESSLSFFNKLSEKLNLDKSKFLFVPGNHEITAKSEDETYNFTMYEKFINDFYRDEIIDIYGKNYRDKFSHADYSFDYQIKDKVLISGFHRKNYNCREIDYKLIDNKMIEITKKDSNNEKLIKMVMLHEAILPNIDTTDADLIQNAAYFVKKLVSGGYKIFFTGHSHKSDCTLVNSDYLNYLNISVGPFGLEKHKRSYNIVKVDTDCNIITVISYSAEADLSSPFVLVNKRSYEVRKSGIVVSTNLYRTEINLKTLLSKLPVHGNLKDIVLKFLLDNSVDSKTLTELDTSPHVYLSYDALNNLAQILGKQVKDLIFEIQDIDEPVEIRPIYRGKEGGNEIFMNSLRRNIVEDEDIKKYVRIYIDDVKFIQKDKQAGKPDYRKGKYICIEPATNKHGSVVLPIDKEGKILLVNQFRHPQRKFITEAIRGFSNFEDDNELITALREFSEEGGGPSLKDLQNSGLDDILIELTKENEYIHIDNEQCAIKDIFYLRSLYTDTGKLWEAPHYYLFKVDHKLQNNNIIRNEPIMESPIWVKFKYVLRSIVQNKAIQLKNNEIEDVFEQNEFCINKRDHLLKYRDPLIEEYKIYIEDAFTSQIIFLSLPRLKQFIDHEIVNDIFQELNY